MIRFYILAFVCICHIPILTAQWSPVASKTGNAGDKFGNQVAISRDGSVVALTSADTRDTLEVFDVVSGVLNPKGSFSFGTSGDGLRAIDLSADGNIIAIGLHDNNDNANFSGKVVVYQFIAGSWSLLGTALYGTGSSDFGYELALSSDGTRLVVGHRTTINGSASVYDYDGTNWVQVGSTLLGDEGNSNFGSAVDISADGTRIVVGAPLYGAADIGQVKVFDYNGTDWSIVGTPLVGAANNDGYGAAVAISEDKQTISIGAPTASNGGGKAIVYAFDGTSWVQKGATFAGAANGVNLGRSVDISYAGDTLAFSIPEGGTFFNGLVKIFAYNDCQATWDSIGAMTLAIFDRMGNDIKLSQNGERIVIGSPLLGSDDSGMMSIFETGPPSVQQMKVMGQGSHIINGSLASSIVTGTFFDTAYIGNAATDVTRTFDIKNVGDQDLILDSIVINGNDNQDFTFTGITFPHRLCKGDSTTFDVLFSPKSKLGEAFPAKINRQASINVYSNDPLSSYHFVVEGKAAGEATVRVTFGSNVDVHGTVTGDVLLTYSPSAGGNISNTATINIDGSGLDQGVQNGALTSGTLTVEPLGIMEDQIWYLYYDDASSPNYPSVLHDFAQNGTAIVTGIGSTPVSIQASVEGGFTDYLFYTEAPGIDLASTPTLLMYQDTTGLPIDSFVQMDSDISISDSDLQALNANFGNYNNTTISIERQGGAMLSDIFGMLTNADYTLTGNTVLYKGDSLATLDVSGNKLSLDIASKTIIPTDDIISGLLQQVSYKNTSSPLRAAIPLQVSFDNGAQTGLVHKILYPAPDIQSFAPSTGGVGDTIILSGYNFDGIHTVRFGGVDATAIDVRNDSTLAAVVGTGNSGFIVIENKFGKDSLAGFVFDNETQPPVLNAPDSNQSYVLTLPIDYSFPEAMLSGSAKLIFAPESGAPIVWQLADLLDTSFSYTIGEDPSLLDEVVSGAMVPLGIYSVSISYQDSLGNPAAAVLHPNITLSDCKSSSTRIDTACVSYNSPGGNTYTVTGIYKDTLQNQFSCDSVITIDLTIEEADETDTTVVACDSFMLASGEVVYASGLYIDTLVNQAGCDSFWLTYLTIRSSTASSDEITVCGSYTTPSGKVISTTGIYQDTIGNQAGCDSILNLDVTILMPTGSNITESSCDSFVTASGKVVFTTGIVYDTIPNAVGCDSILQYNLTIHSSGTGTLAVQRCTDYTAPSGKVLSSTGVYFDTILTSNGCDSIITINFTLDDKTENTIVVEECDSFRTPSGTLYTSSAIHRDTFGSSSNCDSIIVYDITIHESEQTPLNVTSCDVYTAPSGKTWTLSGNYTDTLQTFHGCDSILVINLSIVETYRDSLNETACGSFTSPSGKVWTSSGSYTDSLQSGAGCDSIVVYNLEIHPIELTDLGQVVRCDSFVLPTGKIINSTQIVHDTLIAFTGCDSILKYDVLIHGSFDTSYSVQTCDAYTSPWGELLEASGIYIDTMQTIHGCDSIYQIDLEILTFKDTSFEVSACDRYITPSGLELDESQVWIDTLGTAGGCDSVLSINVTINYSTASTLTIEKMGTYTSSTGSIYTQSGFYVDTVTNAAGCDSLINLDLSILNMLEVAEALSPNADGINDTWIIKDAETIPNITLSILNRWGEIVYESEGYQNDWGGTFKDTGKQLPTGPYYYKLTISGNAQEGWLYITD